MRSVRSAYGCRASLRSAQEWSLARMPKLTVDQDEVCHHGNDDKGVKRGLTVYTTIYPKYAVVIDILNEKTIYILQSTIVGRLELMSGTVFGNPSYI